MGGAPWIVRSGTVVLVGSRFDPAWTTLPLRAGFVPLVDALVNRIARGELAILSAAPGDPVLVPDLTTTVASGPRRWTVEGGSAFHPPAPGIYYLLAGGDTLGGVAVNLDPRESALQPAPDAQVRALWPGARVVGLRAVPGAAFAGLGRAGLAGPLLWLALLFAAAELLLASGLRRRS